jgi:hypothetical protein
VPPQVDVRMATFVWTWLLASDCTYTQALFRQSLGAFARMSPTPMLPCKTELVSIFFLKLYLNEADWIAPHCLFWHSLYYSPEMISVGDEPLMSREGYPQWALQVEPSTCDAFIHSKSELTKSCKHCRLLWLQATSRDQNLGSQGPH